MIDKIVIMPDSFKNTMSSEEVCEIIKNSFLELGCSLPIYTYPIADGGEGTAKIFSKYLKLKMCKMTTTNAFNKNIEIEYGSDGKVAVIDIASIVGFAANAGGKLNPQIVTTYGVGEVLKKIINTGHQKIYVGLGGSITNDLGLGMVSSLGGEFTDENGDIFIPVGKTMKNVKKIKLDNFINYNGKIICLSDVRSPLLGQTGAAKMFAVQKGADPEMVEELEEDAKVFLEVAKKAIGEYQDYPGSGAAGGLGYAFKAFLGAEMVSGINEVLKISEVEYNIDENSLVITGEGSFDEQSLEGKVISGVIDMVQKTNAKLIIVSGVVDENVKHDSIEKCFSCSTKGRKLEEIKKSCQEDLRKTIQKVYDYLCEKSI